MLVSSSLKSTLYNNKYLKSLQEELVLSQHSVAAKAVVFHVPDNCLEEKIVACVSIRQYWRWIDATTNHQGERKEVS